MNTKDRILQAAIEVYNAKGISATTRHIAEHISISPGNLHYHFKHTDEIMLALYHNLAREFDGLVLDTGDKGEGDPEKLETLIAQSFRISYKYRFILLNFVEIARRVPMIQSAYQELVQRRKIEFGSIFEALMRNGYLRDDLDAEVWDALVTQLFIISDFWLSHNEIVDRLDEHAASIAYSALMRNAITPYLK